MSEIIDKKIVEMQFDNKDFEQNASKSISTLGILRTALDFTNPANLVSKGFKKIKEAMTDIDYRQIASDIEQCADSFGTFVKTVVNVYGIQTAVNALQSLQSTVVSLTKSMTVAPISTGWGKYADKTVAVQTIMAATGKTVDDVNASLEKLIWYADETSYSISDMTTYLGSFTSAGVEMETGIKAIMGISNLSAIVGKGKGEAARAMYNFAQALAVGAVKMQDWKSIEGAGMASPEFKQNIMDAAVQVGTLIKQGDKYYTKTKRSAVTTANFSSTLNEAWFSAEVLTKALEKYGSYSEKLYDYMQDLDDESITASEAMEKMGYSIDDVGYKSFKAAQEALTFQQAIESIQDAASSQWSITFENIFGNYDEARKLWTDVANELYDIFGTPGDERNDFLSEALGMSHHEKLIKHIEDAGGAEEEFNRAAAKVIVKHGFRLDWLGDKYETLEEYVADTDMWATPEVIAESLDELSKAYTVAGNTPERAAENWLDLQNKIKAAGGSVEDFMKTAVEVSGDIHFDEFKNFDEWAMQNLDASLIGKTFGALADAGTESNEVIKKNTVSLSEMNKLIDDILAGKLGAGQERIDELTKRGYKAEEVQKLVNKRVREGSIEYADLDKTLQGVAASSEELITFYEKQSDFYAETQTNIQGLAEECRTAGSEMWTLSKYFNTPMGREFIAESIIEMLQQLKAAIEVVKEAWADIFPPMTALQLTEIVQKIRDFIFSLKLSDEAAANLKETFKGLFSILRLVKQVIQAGLHILSPILNNIVGIRDGILGITGALGGGLEKLTGTIGSLFDAFRENTTLSTVSEILGSIGGKISDIVKNFASLFTYTDYGNIKIFEVLENAIDTVWNKIIEVKEAFLMFWNGMQLDLNAEGTLGGFLQGLVNLIGTAIFYIRQGVEWIIRTANTLLTYITKTFVRDLFNGLTGILRLIVSFEWRRGFEKLLAIITKFVNSLKNGGIGKTIKDVGKEITDAFSGLSDLKSNIGDFFGSITDAVKDRFKELKSKAIMEFAFAVAIIAGACWVLAQVPAERLVPAATAVSAMMYIMMDVFKKLTTADPDQAVSVFKKLQKIKMMDMVKMALAMLIVAKAVAEIGKLDFGSALQGTLAVVVIMRVMTEMMKRLQTEKKMFQTGGMTAIAMAIAIRIIVGAVKPLGELNFGAMMKGVTGIGIILAELSGAYVLLSKNKSKFQTGAVVLLSMAASVRILKDVVMAFASLDVDTMWRSVAAVGSMLVALAGAYVLLSVNSSKFQMGGITMLMMAASVRLLGETMKVLADINPESYMRALGGTLGLIGALVAAYYLLGKNNSLFQTGGITMLLMANSVRILGAVLKQISDIPLAKLAVSVGVLTGAIIGMVGLMNVLAGMQSVAAQALPALGVMFLTILAIRPLVNAIIDLARMNPARVFTALAAIFLGIISVFGAMVVLAALPAVIGPVMIGIAALAGCVLEVGILIAAMGALYQIPGAQWLIGEGKKFLRDLGEAIGGFFGGIGAEMVNTGTGKLTTAADNLVDFIKHMEPFFASIKKVDEGAIQNLDNLMKVMAKVVALASADWIYQLASGGKSAIAHVGEQMAEFGKAINRFTAGVLGINTGTKDLAPLNMYQLNLLKIILDDIHTMLGWQLEFPQKEFKKFTENLRKFALDMKVLGPAVAQFFAGCLMMDKNGIVQIDANKIKLIKDAVPIITDLANTEFKSEPSDMEQFTTKMGEFASDLPALGTALNKFIYHAAGLDKQDPSTITLTQADVDLVKSAVPIVTDLANVDFSNATETDLFATQTKMEQFGSILPGFGTALNDFIKAVAGIQITKDSEGNAIDAKRFITTDDVGVVNSAVEAAQAVAGIKFENRDASGLTTLGEDLTSFGTGLTALGKPLGTFIDGLAGSGFKDGDGNVTVPAVKAGQADLVKKAIEAVTPLAGIEINYEPDPENLGRVKTALSVFGTSLVGFGTNLSLFINGLTESGFTTDSGETVPKINSDKISTTTAAIDAVRPLCEITMPNTTGLKQLIEGGEGDLTDLADGLSKLGKPLHDFITSVAQLDKDYNNTAFDIRVQVIENTVKPAIGVIAALADIEIPKTSGWKGSILGDNTLDLLVKDGTLASIGTQLSTFIRAFMAGTDKFGKGKDGIPSIDPNDATSPVYIAKTAVGIIDALAKIEIPDQQNGLAKWLTGDNSLVGFAADFQKLGEGLHALIVAIVGINEENPDGHDVNNSMITTIVKPAIDILKELSELNPELRRKDGIAFRPVINDLKDFSAGFKDVGKNIRNLIDNVAGITDETPSGNIDMGIIAYVKGAVEIVKTLGAAAKDIAIGKNADFDKFGTELEKFVPHLQAFILGINGIFSDKEHPIDKAMVESALSIVPIISALFDKDLPEVPENSEASQTYIGQLAKELSSFIDTVNSKTFTNDNIDVITNFVNGMKEADTSALEAFNASIPKIIEDIKTSMNSMAEEFKGLGKNVIAGMTQGLQDLDAITQLRAAAGSLATITKEEIASALGIESPSKVMRDYIGGNITAGMVQGLQNGIPSVASASGDFGTAVSSGVIDGMQTIEDSLDQVDISIDTDEIQETADAVADLDKRLNDILENSVKNTEDLNTGLDDVEEEVEDIDFGSDVKKAVKDSDLGAAFAEGMKEESGDEVAGFVDETVASFNSRQGEIKESASGLVQTLLTAFRYHYSSFEEIGAAWAGRISEALGANIMPVTLITGIVRNVKKALKDLDFGDFEKGSSADAFIDFMDDLASIFGHGQTIDTTSFTAALTDIQNAVNNLKLDEGQVSLVTKLANDIANAAKNLSGVNGKDFAGVVKAVADAVEENSDDIAHAADTLVQEMLTVFNDYFEHFYAIGVEFVRKIAEGMEAGAVIAADTASTVASQILGRFREAGQTEGGQVGKDIVQSITDGLSSDEAKQTISDAVDSLLNPDEESETTVDEGTKSLQPGDETSGMGEEDTSSPGKKYATNFVNDLASGITDGVDTINGAIQSLTENADLTTFTDTMKENLENSYAQLSAPIETLSGALSSILPDGSSLANNMIDGMINALYARLQEAVDAVTAFASALAGAMMAALEINSPSKVFYRIGEGIIEGTMYAVYDGIGPSEEGMYTYADRIVRGFVKGFRRASKQSNPSLKKAAGSMMETVGSSKIQAAAENFEKTAKDVNQTFQQYDLGTHTINFDETQHTFETAEDMMKDWSQQQWERVLNGGEPYHREVTVTPVFDLTNVDKAADEINKSFEKQVHISADINTEMNSARKNAGGDQANGQNKSSGTTINFVQNNTSPQALTPSKVYKNTKTLLQQIRSDNMAERLKRAL